MRVEHCYLCGGWIIAWPSYADLSWADITRAVRRHNDSRLHQTARAMR